MTQEELKQYIESYNIISNIASPQRVKALRMLDILNINDSKNVELINLARVKGLMP